jgi:hypothetical protein
LQCHSSSGITTSAAGIAVAVGGNQLVAASTSCLPGVLHIATTIGTTAAAVAVTAAVCHNSSFFIFVLQQYGV